MEKQKLPYIDSLRGMAMLLVIMGHTIYFCIYQEQKFVDSVFSLICTFHVPLFFFLSGVVITSPRNLKKFLGKAYRFLVPMLIVGFINALLIGNIHDFFLNGGHNGYWYLLTLTIFYMMMLLFPIQCSKGKWFTLFVNVVLTFSVWTLFYLSMRLSNTVFDALNPWGSYAFWPFFIGGYLFRKYKIIHILTSNIIITSIFILAYLLTIILYFNQLNEIPEYIDFIIAWIAIIALYGLFLRFNNKTWLMKQLTLIGNNTLNIYIYHYFFIRFIHLEFLSQESLLTELLMIIPLTIVIAYGSIGIEITINHCILTTKTLISKI